MGTKRQRMALAAIALGAWMSLASAESSLNNEPNGSDTRVLQELYGGVVANQTMTVVGQDFYQHFVATWRDKAMSERYALSIHERPSARWGSLVWVEYAQRRVFQIFLPPARANIKAVSEHAAEVSYQSVVDTEVQRLLFRDPDLGHDEI